MQMSMLQKPVYYVAVDVDRSFTQTALFGEIMDKRFSKLKEEYDVVLLTANPRTSKFCTLNDWAYKQVELSAIAELANECVGIGHCPSDVVANCAVRRVKTRQIMYKAVGMPVALIA